jgi:uncharacterized protein (TIGR02145 family)
MEAILERKLETMKVSGNRKYCDMNKNIFRTLCLAALLSACQMVEEVHVDPVVSDAFTAIIETFETETKTHFENNSAVWSENDDIAVFQGKSHADKYVLKSSSSAVFTLAESYKGSVEEVSTNIAAYPYVAGMSCEEDDTAYFVRNVSFPEIQQFKQGSFAERSFIMVAKTSKLKDRTLEFKNACGGLRLQVRPLKGDSVAVKSIILEGHDGEKLSGSADISYSKTGAISYQWKSGAKDYIKVEVPSVVLDTLGTPFQCVISLPPVNFAKGFSITINAEVNGIDSSYTRTTVKPQSIKRSRFLTMPDINFGEYILMPSLNLSHRELDFTFESGKKTIELTSNTDWTGTSDSDWVTLSPASGNGSRSVIVTTKANEGPVSRTAVLKFNVQDIEKTVTVTQAAMPSVDISRSFATVRAGGEEVSLNITSNVDWIATTGNSWISVEPSSGVGADDPVTVLITASANAAESLREGSVVFNAGGVKKTFTITQRGKISEEHKNDYIDEYGINHGKGVKIGELIWAPVNCGYHASDFKYGKLYQWGRKYGQGYDGGLYNSSDVPAGQYQDSKYAEVVSAPVLLNVAQSEDNADKFYMCIQTPWDWLVDYEDFLWNLGSDTEVVKTEYDPCPEGWRVPTQEELEGLLDNAYWTPNDEDRLVYHFPGEDPENGDPVELSLISAGNHTYDGGTGRRGSYGAYWSSSTRTYFTYYLHFSHNELKIKEAKRVEGLSVRCVKDDEEFIYVNSVTMDKTTLTLQKDDTYDLKVTFLPSDATHKHVYWESSDPDVATVVDGRVKALSSGTALITAMVGMKAATCEVNVYTVYHEGDYVDEYGINHGQGITIDGVVWAPVNCGYHKNDFKYGKLYQWGRKYGQGYSGDFYSGQWGYVYKDAEVAVQARGPVSLADGQSKDNADKFYYVSSNSAETCDWCKTPDDKMWNKGDEQNPVKTEYDPCPDGWRVPTYAELSSLIKNSSSFDENDDKNGRWFSGSKSYSSASSKAFFPAAGYYNTGGGSGYNRGYNGYYWSSKPSTYNAYRLYFGDSSVRTGLSDFNRGNGFSVRCVLE